MVQLGIHAFHLVEARDKVRIDKSSMEDGKT
jgi:hypothetical protein